MKPGQLIVLSPPDSALVYSEHLVRCFSDRASAYLHTVTHIRVYPPKQMSPSAQITLKAFVRGNSSETKAIPVSMIIVTFFD